MREARPRSEPRNRQITEKEAADVEEMSSPRTPVIYEIVRRLGDEGQADHLVVVVGGSRRAFDQLLPSCPSHIAVAPACGLAFTV
jgi:hypothetical protein